MCARARGERSSARLSVTDDPWVLAPRAPNAARQISVAPPRRRRSRRRSRRRRSGRMAAASNGRRPQHRRRGWTCVAAACHPLDAAPCTPIDRPNDRPTDKDAIRQTIDRWHQQQRTPKRGRTNDKQTTHSTHAHTRARDMQRLALTLHIAHQSINPVALTCYGVFD